MELPSLLLLSLKIFKHIIFIVAYFKLIKIQLKMGTRCIKLIKIVIKQKKFRRSLNDANILNC